MSEAPPSCSFATIMTRLPGDVISANLIAFFEWGLVVFFICQRSAAPSDPVILALTPADTTQRGHLTEARTASQRDIAIGDT
jgi:hypothetical protein